MKRIFTFIIVLSVFLSLSGCKDNKINENTVVIPDDNTAKTVNGYKSETPLNPEVTTIFYVANKTTKKFHLESCQYAKSSNTANLTETTDRESLVNDGYSPCKVCAP